MEVTGLTPLYPCDSYDAVSRTCINIRQLGTTVTLGVQAGNRDGQTRQHVRWFRYYKRRGNLPLLKKEFSKEGLPWNINIGGESNELRISPLTEIDFSYNYFVAMVDITHGSDEFDRKSKTHQFIKFFIEPINIDMGALYPGEELVIYARAFMELPMSSVSLEWSLSNSDFRTRYNLPSNMKVNADGSSVIVKELRTAVDKVLICAVYSNKNFFLARRNFLFRKIVDFSKHKRESTTSNLNFKRRRKRSSFENEGFSADEELKYQKPHIRFSEINNYENENKNYGIYDNRDEQYERSPTFSRSMRDRKDMSDQPLENLRINNELFYNEDDKPVSFDAEFNSYQRRKRREKESIFPKQVNKLESQFQDTNNREPKNYDYNRKSQYKGRIPVQTQQEIDDDNELLNNDVSSNILPHKSHFYNKQSVQSNGRNRNSDSKLDRFSHTQRVNNLGLKRQQIITEDNDTEQSDVLNIAEHEKYSFDDIESEFIANCKDRFDCNINALCHKSANGNQFCRCKPQYNGNGLFCWLL
ncbi:uncharacterized protein NPIL_415751 [Nephila pilipes]|uniref:Uncharacterized protein n=1 Tax=Nephila pilipes TaxID=299642 RepID=A0A8X6P2G7_NEPPI|nr:uncharacterized protein NPIL_415751 [Nephila pilipes]